MIFNFLSFRTTLHSIDYLNFLYFEFFFFFFNSIIMIFSTRLKKRQRFNEIKKLNIFDFNQKIDDFERFFDIYIITTMFDFTKSNFIIILTSIDIFNFSKLKKTTFEQFARFWEILKFFRKNRNKNINIIRVWNNREKYIKTKNLKHFLEFDEINAQFETNRIEIRKFRKKIDKQFVVHNNRKIKRKEKIKKEFSNDQNVDVFSKINYDEKIDFFKIRSKNKKLIFKYIDFFIFYKHKNSNIFDYIRYDIWKNKCVNKLKINANWYFIK